MIWLGAITTYFFIFGANLQQLFTSVGLRMFSKQLNREWQAAGKAFTLLGLYLDVDFELVEVNYTASEVWTDRYPESISDPARLLKESEIHSNLIKDVEMTLIAVK